MAEWLKAHAWKACLLERVTWVRIPLSPPLPLLSDVYKGLSSPAPRTAGGSLSRVNGRMCERSLHFALRRTAGGVPHRDGWSKFAVDHRKVTLFLRGIDSIERDAGRHRSHSFHRLANGSERRGA